MFTGYYAKLPSSSQSCDNSLSYQPPTLVLGVDVPNEDKSSNNDWGDSGEGKTSSWVYK